MSRESSEVWDVLVVGAGPAGLAAAVNARARGKSTLVLGAELGSARLKKAQEVRNYLGLPGVTGEELAERFLAHAREAGAVVAAERVTAVYPGSVFTCTTQSAKTFRARAVVLAVGVTEARLLPGERELLGRGVSYCATCDGPLFRGQRVAVVGEVPEAEEEANFLARICEKVYFFPRYEGELRLAPGVEVRREAPEALVGEDYLTGLAVGGEVLPVAGVFIIRKTLPPAVLIEGLRVEEGAVVVDRGLATNVPGVFAAGDCTGRPYQIAKAVGEGAVAALSAVRYLDSLA